MTAELLYEEFEKLNDVESVKFIRMINRDRKGEKGRLEEMKKDVLRNFMKIKDGSGKSYFDEDEIKKKLGL